MAPLGTTDEIEALKREVELLRVSVQPPRVGSYPSNKHQLMVCPCASSFLPAASVQGALERNLPPGQKREYQSQLEQVSHVM